MTIVLIGTTGVAVLVALGAAATGASTNRSLGDVQAALASAGDALTDTPADIVDDTYLDCSAHTEADIVAAYESVVDAAASGVDVVDVEFWTGIAWSTATCAYDAGERLQRITLTATVDGTDRRLRVVKRPALEPTVAIGPLPPGSGGDGPDVEIEPNPAL